MSVSRLFAPRPGPRAGAFVRALIVAFGVTAVSAGRLDAQVPPDTVRADTLRVDTLRVDTLRVDTLRVDTLRVDSLGRPLPPDTIQQDSVSADTIFYNLPDLAERPAGGWAGGVWTWDHEAILATEALTLVDLVETVPGMIALRAGDFGTPLGVTAFGLGGGRIRVFRDGFELTPLGGASVDLSRVGLGGITRVRLERRPGEVRIDLSTFRFSDGRAYSLIEAGTGDLNTNIFRGMFANPTTLGGDIALALERLDSRGSRGNEPGFEQGTWLRYQLHREDRAGLAVDFRRMASETEAEPYAAKVTRTDLTVRGSAQLFEALTAQAYWGRSSHDVEDTRDAYLTEGGRRTQAGLLASWTRDGLTADAAWRHFGGAGLPRSDLEFSIGADRPAYGGFAAGIERAAWAGTSTSAKHVRAWTRPLLGLSLFGSWESGTYGARVGPIADVMPPLDTTPVDSMAAPDTTTGTGPGTVPAAPDFRVTNRTASRLGAQWVWKDVALSGAKLRLETDSLLPIGLQPDRSGPALSGGVRTGWEAWARVPLPILDGLHAEGSLQKWDQAWSYMPEQIYRGAIAYHRTFLESGNFELWWSVGVTGHGPMTVRQVLGDATNETGDVAGPELALVPFYQNWFGRIQIRIVTVHVFIGWNNFTVRRNLQDFPARLLPGPRAFYGIRWTMWN